MTVTIELKPAVEARIKAEAEVLGIPIEDYLESVIENQIAGVNAQPLSGELTPEERAKAWEAWAASHNLDTPVIIDDSREAIYGDDGR